MGGGANFDKIFLIKTIKSKKEIKVICIFNYIYKNIKYKYYNNYKYLYLYFEKKKKIDQTF